MSKKAQLISQVFVYIISAMVLILILFFGYRTVAGLSQKNEQLLLYRFVQDLTSSVDDMRLRYGSVDIPDFSFSNTFDELCFVTDKALVSDLPTLKNNRPGIHNSWIAGEYDIFSLPTSDVRLKIANLEVKNDLKQPATYCCFKVDGKISLRLEGAGKTVVLSSGNPDAFVCGE